MVITTQINPSNYISSQTTSINNQMTIPISDPVIILEQNSMLESAPMLESTQMLIASNLPSTSMLTASDSTTTSILAASDPTTKSKSVNISPNTVELKNYEVSDGYISGLVLFICFGLFFIFLFFFFVIKKIFKEESLLLEMLILLCIIGTFASGGVSIHFNRVKMNKDIYSNKTEYNKFIEAAWILPTTILSIIASIIGMFILSAFVKATLSSFNQSNSSSV